MTSHDVLQDSPISLLLRSCLAQLLRSHSALVGLVKRLGQKIDGLGPEAVPPTSPLLFIF